MSLGGFFFRKREYPPAEGTFDVAARARVEPLGHAPTIVPSATFTVTAIARVEPVGEAPPAPDPPTNNAAPGFAIFNIHANTRTILDTGTQSWTNPGGATTIRVQEADDAGFNTNLTEVELAGSATEYEWTNQKDGVTRYYRVRAESGSGNSAWSSTETAKHYEAAPSVPQSVIGFSSSSSGAGLSWQAPASGGSVDHYDVERDNKDGSFANRQTTAGTISSYSGLDAAEAYGFRVRASGPDSQVSAWVTIVQAVQHDAPDLTGCYEERFEGGKTLTYYKLDITDNSPEATSFKVDRNGSLYDTIGTGDQEYEPATQSGSWRVSASGGVATHPTLGNDPIPESDHSATKTMSGDFDDVECGPPL